MLPVARVLITGMSGAGKTTLLDELRRRGHRAVDTDYDDWELPGGAWDEQRTNRLLAGKSDLVVSGTVHNQGDSTTDSNIMSAPLGVLLDRVMRRQNNSYGKTIEDRLKIRRYVGEVERLLRRGATIELDGRCPVSDLADTVQALVRSAV